MHNGIFYSIADYAGDDMTRGEQHLLMVMVKYQPKLYTLSLDDPSKHVCISHETLALKSRSGIATVKRLAKSAEKKGFIVSCGYRGHIKCYAFSPEKLKFCTDALPCEHVKNRVTSPLSPYLSLVPSVDEGDPLGDLQEYEQGSPSRPAGDHQGPDSLDLVEQVTRSSRSPGTALSPLPDSDQVEQGSPLPGHQVTRPGINKPWSPETMVDISACIAGRDLLDQGEYERELQAARIIFTLKPEHTDFKPIDRATFETAYTFEHSRGVLAKKKGRALSLVMFENMTTLDMAIRLSREESAKKQEKQEKTVTFIEGAGHLGRDVDTSFRPSLTLTDEQYAEQYAQHKAKLDAKRAEIARKIRQTPVIRPGRVERQRTNDQAGL